MRAPLLLAAALGCAGCGERPPRVPAPPDVSAATDASATPGWRFPFPPDVGPRTRARLNDLQAVRVDELGAVVADDSPRASGVLTDGDPAAADELREGLPEAGSLEAWLVEGGDPAALPTDFAAELARTDTLLREMHLPTLFSPLLRLHDEHPGEGLAPSALPSLRTLLGPELADQRLRPLVGARGMTRVAAEALDEASLVLLGRKRVFQESPGKAAVRPSATMWGFRQSVIEAQLAPAGRARLATWFREGRDALRLALAATGRVLADPDAASEHGPLVELVVEALDEDLFLLLFTELAERPADELLGSRPAQRSPCEPAGYLRFALTHYQWFVAQTRIVDRPRRERWAARLRGHGQEVGACLVAGATGPWGLRALRRTHPGEGLFSNLESDLEAVLSGPPDRAKLAAALGRAAFFRVQDTVRTWGLVKRLAARVREEGLAEDALRAFGRLPPGTPIPPGPAAEWRAILATLEARGY